MGDKELSLIPERWLTDGLAKEIQFRLSRPGPFLMLPSHLRQVFRTYRHRDLKSYVRLGSPFLMLLVVGIIALNTLVNWPTLQRVDLMFWLVGSGFVALCVFLGILSVLPEASLRYYSRLVSIPAVLVLTKLCLTPSMFTEPSLGVSESYFCSLAVIVVVLALKLTLLDSVAILVTTTVIAGSVGLFVDAVTLNWVDLMYYYGFVAAVCIFIAWQNEEQEKREFLQSVLVSYSAKVNRELTRQLEMQANRDPLTQLSNRRHFDRQLNHEWDRAAREQESLSLLYIDIDHFKQYNDHYGHGQGDECLVEVARVLEGVALRPADIASRIGGEEFAILLPGTLLEGAEQVGQRALDSLRALALPHEMSPEGLVTLSIGVASVMPSTDGRPGALVEEADRALYRAKSEGRNRVCKLISSVEPHRGTR